MENSQMAETFRINDIDPATLEKERERALELLTEVVPVEYVHEVGSTAIDGLIGKQDLDFLVRVPLHEFQASRAALDKRFTRNAEQLSNDEYQGYKTDSDHDVAIQLTIEGGPYDTFLIFLDQLRKRSDLRDEYNELKKTFDGRAMSEYRAAKREFVENVLASISER